MNTAQKRMPKIIVIFFLAICFINCVEKKKEEPKEEPEEKPVVDAPKNIISLEQADLIYGNYSDHRAKQIETYEKRNRAPGEDFEAARFVDFDYDTVKQYIDFIDQEAAKAGVKKVTNLRLYFANYSKDQEFPEKKEVNQTRRNSIFMVPTLDRDGVNYGFYIGENGEASLITDRKIGKGKGMGLLHQEPQKAYAGFSLNSSFAGSSLTLNFGHGGPPPATDF